MEKKKNSIEWLVQELNRNIDFIPNVHHWDKIRDIIQQAKAMHKEEIKIAWNHGFDWGMMEQSLAEQGMESTLINAEQYYNETFGGQDNE